MDGMALTGLSGWVGTVLSTPDPARLVRFWSELLGWPIYSEEPTYATIGFPGATAYLGFHLDEAYEPPVWPSEHGKPQMQLHLDVGVNDVAAAVEQALALGATQAEFQPQDVVRVMLDPDGHPFCLYQDDDVPTDGASNAAKVRAFHDGIGDGYPVRPTVPPLDLLNLRLALIDEEHAEVQQAVADLRAKIDSTEGAGPLDLTHVASELVDLLYVTYGALAAMGMPTDEIFDAIHEANMRKLDGPRREDGKLLKPEGWQPPDIRTLIEREAQRE